MEAADALLDGEAERPTWKAIEKALEGDAIAMRLCLEPLNHYRPLRIDLPPTLDAAGIAAAQLESTRLSIKNPVRRIAI